MPPTPTPTPSTRSRCGCARRAAWPSWWPTPSLPEEPPGTEPDALVAQAVDAVARIAGTGLLSAGGRVVEYRSPHGGSWLGLLAAAA